MGWLPRTGLDGLGSDIRAGIVFLWADGGEMAPRELNKVHDSM